VGWVLLRYWVWRRHSLAALGDPQRVLQQLSGDSLRIFRWRVVLLLIAISGMIFSAAGPRLSKEGDSDTTAVDVMVLLDISESMLVADVAPNRLLVAKSFIRKLEARLSEYRIGLTLFAGVSFVQAPLSLDRTFFLESVAAATPEVLTRQGSDLGGGIRSALEAFQSDSARKVLVVITDMEDHEGGGLQAAREALKAGVLVFAIGVGTQEGGGIPIDIGGVSTFKRDVHNEIIRSILDMDKLKGLSESGGGKAWTVGDAEVCVAALGGELDGLLEPGVRVSNKGGDKFYYAYFLFPAFVALLLEWWIGKPLKPIKLGP